MSPTPLHVTSPANAQFQALRRLVAGKARGQAWLEGEHLCQAALDAGWQPQAAVFAASYWKGTGQRAPASLAQRLAARSARCLVLADALMRRTSTLPSPAPLACVLALPRPAALDAHAPSVVLDRVQDAGNAGSILRSAAAFGFTQVLALAGSAQLWSPKVLRAGMGAHFSLHLHEGLTPDDVVPLAVPLLAASAHQGQWLHRARLPWPCAWVIGNEGQGISAALAQRAAQHVRIIQPGGQESLNAAAAAAVCLHASAAAQAAADA